MKKHIGFVLAFAVVVGSLFATVAGASSHASSKATLVTVTMTDYHFKLSKATGYKKGVAYTFKAINKGAAFHNFDIQGVKATKVVTHGKSSSFTVTFKKAGKYQYICDVPRHAELGMAGTLKVS
jgi:plastocyanin